MHVATVLLSDPRPVKPAACLRHEPVQVPRLYPTVLLVAPIAGLQHLKPPLPLDPQYHPPEQQCVSISHRGEYCPSRQHIKGSHNPLHKLERNQLEERLLDQAQARASYTPLFWGHLRSIPQGMILDVQPLVKSLFCPIRPSPNEVFDSEAFIP